MLSSWLALTDDAFVGELRQCLFVPNEIQQVSLPSDTAGRSARLFYLLQQALAKWDRGLEILRSVSTRQGNAAAGYEGVRELYRQYSVNSRMEAVYIRDEMLKLHTKTGSLKRPLEVVRFLEDEISKGDKKLVRFPDLCLNAADRSAILLQAVSVQAREYLVLHGKTGSWNEMAESLRFYEEQLRMVELPGGGLRGLKGEKGKGDAKGKKGSKNSGSGADKSKVACWYCGKTGHYQEECRQRLADEKKKGKGHGEHKGKDKGKGQGAKNNKNDKPETKGKGERGKGKGKNKKQQARAVAEGEAEEEPEGETVMALQASGELVPVGARGGVLRTTPGPTPEVSALAAHQVRLVGIESQDSFWLVDSGATSHCMSASCFEKYEVLRTYDFKPTLSNASNDMIEVLKVCDVRVRFGKQVVVLEHCLITNLDFNVLSPYVAYVKGWHTLLTGSPHIYNKKSKKRIRLTVKDRAWYAVASLKDDSEKMEVDALKPQATTAKPPKAPEIPLKQEAPRANKAKKAQKAQDRRSLESVKSLEYTPFKFLLRSLRTHGGSAVPVCEGVASELSDRLHLDRLGSERWSKDASEAHGVDDESGPWLAWCLVALCVLLALVSDCVQRSRGAFVRECVCKASGLGLFGRLRGGLRRLQGSARASVCARKVSGVGLLCRLRGGLLRLQGSECESVLQGWSRSRKTPKPRKPDAARVALFLVGLTCVHIAKGEQVEVRCVTNVGTDFPTGTAFFDGKPPEEAEYSSVFRGACAPRGLHGGLPGGGDGQCGGESSEEARGGFYKKAAFDSPKQAGEGNSGIRGSSECGRFLRGGSTRGANRRATGEANRGDSRGANGKANRGASRGANGKANEGARQGGWRKRRGCMGSLALAGGGCQLELAWNNSSDGATRGSLSGCFGEAEGERCSPLDWSNHGFGEVVDLVRSRGRGGDRCARGWCKEENEEKEEAGLGVCSRGRGGCGRGARDSTSKRGAASSSTYPGTVPDLWPGGGRGSTSGGRNGVVIAYGGCAGGAYGAGAHNYGSHRSARACSGDGGCRRRGKEEEKEKKEEEGIPGLCRGCCDGGRGSSRECRWYWRHRCGKHRCGKRWSCGPKEAEEKERSSVVVPQVDSKTDPVVVPQVGMPFGSKEAEEKERSSQNSSCGGAFSRRGGAGAGDGAAGAGDGAAYPRSFSASCTSDCGASDCGHSDCGHSGCGPCGCGSDGCGGLSRSKAEAVSKSSGSCSCIRSIAGATVAATAPRACGSVRPTWCRSSSRSTAFWSQSLGIKPGTEALGFRAKESASRATKGSASCATKGSASWATKESSSQKGARAFSVNLMLGYPRVSVFARKRFSVRRRVRRLWQRCGFQSGESLVLLGRAKAEVQVLRLPQYRLVGLSLKGFEVECKAQNPKEAWRFSRVLCEGCCACKAREPTVEAWRFSECVQVFAEAQCPVRAKPVGAEAKPVGAEAKPVCAEAKPVCAEARPRAELVCSEAKCSPRAEPVCAEAKPRTKPVCAEAKPRAEPRSRAQQAVCCSVSWSVERHVGRLSGLLLACLGRLISMLLVCLGWLCLSVR